ncbi:MAG: hypothetical protein M3198_08000 [Actinomycetota bacterium]|nr:hypothetical protein [Actinomycetota bacterium]
MERKTRVPLAWALLVVLTAVALPIGVAVGEIMKAKVVNKVRVQESGAKVIKIFDAQMDSGSRMIGEKSLVGYKTVRVVIYQTVNGASSGAPIDTSNFTCNESGNNLEVKFAQGTGLEGGVTAGNNLLDMAAAPDLATRSSMYAGEFPVIRPRIEVDLCNATPTKRRVVVLAYAFRN